MVRYLPCDQGLKSSMNFPSFRMTSLPPEEIWMFSVYHPMGALAGLRTETVRMLSLLSRSCALQPPALVPLESGNTAFVLADSEGFGPVKADRTMETKRCWPDCGERSDSSSTEGAFGGRHLMKHHTTGLEATGENMEVKSILIWTQDQREVEICPRSH